MEMLVFRGDHTTKTDVFGRPARTGAWYFQPADRIDSEVLFSPPHATHVEARDEADRLVDLVEQSQ